MARPVHLIAPCERSKTRAALFEQYTSSGLQTVGEYVTITDCRHSIIALMSSRVQLNNVPCKSFSIGAE